MVTVRVKFICSLGTFNAVWKQIKQEHILKALVEFSNSDLNYLELEDGNYLIINGDMQKNHLLLFEIQK